MQPKTILVGHTLRMLLHFLFDSQHRDCVGLLLHQEPNNLLLVRPVHIRINRHISVHISGNLLRHHSIPARRCLMQSRRRKFIRKLLVFRRILCRCWNTLLLTFNGYLLPSNLLPVLNCNNRHATKPKHERRNQQSPFSISCHA